MLICFSKEYGDVVQADDESDATFQKREDIQSTRDYIVKTAINSFTSPRRNLISHFDFPSKGQSTSNYNEKPETSTWNSRRRDSPSKQLKYDSEPTTSPLKQNRQRSTATHT